MRLAAAALVVSTLAAQPVREGWIRAQAPGAAQPDVQSVEVTEEEVVVRSAGISLAWLGPLALPARAAAGLRQYTFRLPLRPKPAAGRHAHLPAAYAGVFRNGVPIPNRVEGESYRGQNLWHFDGVARGARAAHGTARAGLLEGLLAAGRGDSPVIGYALDGYPVYGPWWGGRRMRSSYQRRKMATRESWPDGTRMAPGQEGPPVGAEYPLGSFAEDYEYVPGSGDLDEYNGRTVKTAEYPEGTYAYFLSTDANGEAAFPYLLAHEFYGEYRVPEAEGMLRFRVSGAGGRLVRHLEHVHEKPMHVLVIAHDRSSFAHLHPEVNEEGVWEVAYAFPHAGRFRVYAEYTPPGGNARREQYDVTAPGAAAGRAEEVENPGVTLENRGTVRAGEDGELVFRVGDGIRGWQRYLGAWAHVVIAGEGLASLFHAHPMDGLPAGEEHDHTRTPPPDRVRVAANFAAPGEYKLWFQMRVGERVVTVPFSLRVERAAARRRGEEAVPAGAVRVRITAQGYEPARVEIPAGRPVTLAIRRTTEGNCGGRIVFPGLGMERAIAPGATVVVRLPAQPRGEVRFGCGMGMYRGSVVAVGGAGIE
jgi:hypothetical protein